MYQGRGANFVFPEAWEAYEAAIPANERRKEVSLNLFFVFTFSVNQWWSHALLFM